MGATNSFESEVLSHIFLNDPITDIGDAGGLLESVADGNLYIALLTVDPGDLGAITNESAYGGYARVAVPRGAAGWAELNGQVANFANINFPECISGSETLTHFAICKSLAGNDMILHGALPAAFLISAGVQPQFGPSQLVINLD